MPLELPLILDDEKYGQYTSTSKGGEVILSLKNYFQQQPNYNLKGETISYFNDNTGVYFSFHLPNDKHLEDARTCVLFSVCVGRSNGFILEALEEVEKFCKLFNASIYDPHEDNTRALDKYALCDMWKEMNKTLCKIITMNQHTHKYWTLPTDLMDVCWKWNYEIKETEKRFNLPCPKIFYCPKPHTQTKLSTFVVWKISCQTILPTFVDYVVVAVDGFDNKTVILFQTKLSKLRPLLTDFMTIESMNYPLDVIKISNNITSDALMRFVLSQKIIKEKYLYVKEEQILEEESLLA